MALGILGGTFDPVHNAHLAIAGAALEQLALDKVLFIPTGTVRYRAPAIAPAADRLFMLALALDGNPRFAIDARELSAAASGYTVDTLQSLRAEFPAQELVLIIGADQHAAFASWHRPDEVRRLARLAVVARPGFALASDVQQVRMTPQAISSSDIRARAARGENLSRLVPPAVANYISEKRLYH